VLGGGDDNHLYPCGALKRIVGSFRSPIPSACLLHKKRTDISVAHENAKGVAPMPASSRLFI
jgi:hypothetical protein